MWVVFVLILICTNAQHGRVVNIFKTFKEGLSREERKRYQPSARKLKKYGFGYVEQHVIDIQNPGETLMVRIYDYDKQSNCVREGEAIKYLTNMRKKLSKKERTKGFMSHLMHCGDHKGCVLECKGFLIVPYVQGERLLEILLKPRSLQSNLQSILKQLLLTVDGLSARGVILNTINPKNIVMHKKNIKVVSLSGLTVLSSVGPLRAFNMECNNPLYMTPILSLFFISMNSEKELLQRTKNLLIKGIKKKVSPDAYAIGCILFQAACSTMVELQDHKFIAIGKVVHDADSGIIPTFPPLQYAEIQRMCHTQRVKRSDPHLIMIGKMLQPAIENQESTTVLLQDSYFKHKLFELTPSKKKKHFHLNKLKSPDSTNSLSSSSKNDHGDASSINVNDLISILLIFSTLLAF
eukprot:GHVL01022648.1.p1 GENE.GHVL01022648.1~~GHVL01022648.1.p1  ORF type:complete len:408 (+),score=47.13 GHVL01022648.1:72-1295(+)